MYVLPHLEIKNKDFQSYMILKITLTLDICLMNPLEKRRLCPLEKNGASSSAVFGLIS
jgi:hypothetical protein